MGGLDLGNFALTVHKVLDSGWVLELHCLQLSIQLLTNSNI